MRIEDLINLIKTVKKEQDMFISADKFFDYFDKNIKNKHGEEERKNLDKQIKFLLSESKNIELIAKETRLSYAEIHEYSLKNLTKDMSVISLLSKTIDTNEFSQIEDLLISTPEEEIALNERRRKMLDSFRKELNNTGNNKKLN